MKPTRSALFALALLSAAGCGIDDYDQKLKSEQGRVERLDKEFKELDAPLTLPPPREGASNEVQVFLRPPHGIPSQPSKDKDAYVRSGAFYWFKNPTAKDPVKAVALAVAEKTKEPLDPNALLKDLESGQVEWKDETIEPPGRAPFKLKKAIFLNNFGKFIVYVFDVEKTLVGVCYQVSGEQKDQAAVTAQITPSIRTLAVGTDAPLQLQEYAKRAKGNRK